MGTAVVVLLRVLALLIVWAVCLTFVGATVGLVWAVARDVAARLG